MMKNVFFQSRLGRRIFCLFICCSIIPILVFSVLAFTQVMRNLEEQGRRRLHQSTKALGQSILERLLLLDNDLQRIGAEWTKNLRITPPALGDDQVPLSPFKSIFVYHNNDSLEPLVGKVTQAPSIDDVRSKLQTAKAAVFTLASDHQQAGVFLVRSVQSSENTFIVGELDSSYLWSVGVEHTLPPMTDLCVIDQSGLVITSSIPDTFPLLNALSRKRSPEGRDFEWGEKNAGYIANYYVLFLRSRFVAGNWTVILSQAKKDIFAPLDDFRAIFPSVIILSLLVVAFLSMYYIRHTLVPLEKIKEGIVQIAKNDFGARITVQSNDEFQELAATFNDMSRQLGKQFKALTKISEIDSAILSSLDTERIISTVLEGLHGFLSCDGISISLVAPGQEHTIYNYSSIVNYDLQETVKTARLEPADLKLLLGNREFLIIKADDNVPGYLEPVNEGDINLFLVLPVFVKNRLTATINMGYAKSDSPPEEDIFHARQLGDQMAVALSNSALVEELDQLNWGTLKALARTVDAKSSWTAGHSERVLEITMCVAGVLGLGAEERYVLHRAALLHDIGKVGIPNEILDKPSKLTRKEYETIKAHPRIGSRILEPIAAYREVVPIVLQHHEKFDGSGYPDGRSGQNIHLGARILAVADVFDAMIANRPYRVGLDLDDVLRYIRGAAGSHFDPGVVEAFFSVISSQKHILQMFNLPSTRRDFMEDSSNQGLGLTCV